MLPRKSDPNLQKIIEKRRKALPLPSEAQKPAAKKTGLHLLPPYEMPISSGPSWEEYWSLHNPYRGPSEDEWNYRQSVRGMNGEPLPFGAIGWNPRGEAYYGPGTGGYLKGVLSRLSAPVGEILPEGYATSIVSQMQPGLGRVAAVAGRTVEAAQSRIEQASGVAPGGQANIFTYIGRGASELVRGVLLLFQQPARAVERYIGFSRALAEAGAGSPIPYQEGPDWWQYIRNLPPTTLAFNALRYWTSPDRNKADVLAREAEAWRIAYSAIYEPLVREEYLRRMQSREENPELLAMELEVPGAELLGQLISDPLWFVGAGMKGARATRWLGTAERRFGVYADDMLGAVEEIGKTVGRATEGDAVDLVAKLAAAKMRSMGATGERIARQGASRGLFSVLASGKRFVSWIDQGLLSRAIIAAFPNDPDGALEMFGALIKMSSGSLDEVADGVLTSSHFVSPRMLHSQVAEELGITLRAMVTNTEGKIDLGDFLRGWQEAAKTVDGAAAYLTQKVEPALEKLYPTLTDLIAQGVDVGQGYRMLEAFDRSVGQGPVYRVVNTFLSAVYMGLSPGYAVRNYLTNAVHAIVDVGPGVLRNGPEASARAIENILGSVPDIARLGLGPAAGEVSTAATGKWWRYFLEKSAKWETDWSLRVYAKSLRDSMRKLMAVNRGLPPIEPLKNAGFSDDAIRSLLALLEPNHFNPHQAVTAFRQMLADGIIDPVRTGEWMPAKARRVLSDFNVLDEVQTVAQEFRAAGRSVDEAEAAIRRIFADLAKQGDNVVKESGTIAREGEGALDAAAINAMRGEFPDAQLDALIDVVSANRTANATHLSASDDITQALADIKDPNLRGQVQALVQRHSHNASIIDSTANAEQVAARGWKNLWIDKKLGRTVVLGPKTDFAALWNEAGKLGPAPDVITKQTLRNAIFDYYISSSNARWASTREMIADALRLYLDEVRNSLGLPLIEVEAKLRRARAIIARAEELERAAMPAVEGAEAIARAAPVYIEGTMPTWVRVLHESQQGLSSLADELVTELRNTWGNVRPGFSNPGMDVALDAWLVEGARRWEDAKLLAGSVAGEMRNFSLLAYPARRGIDRVLSYIYPYHFWYNRTYAHWLRRLVWNPEIIAAYGKYRAYLEKIHAGAPAWWKQSINTDELLGIETDHPLFFNLEATLNPLNGLTGIDFNDPIKREQWWAAIVDDLGKFGPSVWTPIQIAVAIALKSQGDDEAASRWAGRLIPGTATLKAATALIGHNAGVELDPFIHIFSGGIDPYERNRIARALGAMVQDGLIDEAQAAEAGYYQEGPVWERARERAANERALGQVASFFAGVGFKGRTRQDMEIDRFWTDYNRIWNLEPTLTPDELRGMLDQIRQKYPFMDSMLLARKGGVERDRSFAYNVLARIPPSQSDDFARAVGLDSELLSRFYEEKGHIENWAPEDRTRFMGAVMLLGGLLATPDDATRAEWNEARTRYKQVEAEAVALFGEDIWDRVDRYYAAKGEDQASRDRANAILEADPEIDAALAFKSRAVLTNATLMAYYGSMNMIDGYLSGQMYDEIETELGPQVWDVWDEYWRMKEAGENYRAYYKAHPELARYGDIKDKWEGMIADYMVRLADKIPERVPVSLRPEGDFSSLAAERVFGLAQQQISPVANFTSEDWVAQLGTSLYRLSLDAIFTGGQLTNAAKQALDAQAEALGIPGGWKALLAFLQEGMQ